MEIWVILSSATHATERNVSIAPVELKECWPRSGLDVYLTSCINFDGPTGDIRGKARKVQGRGAANTHQPRSRSVIHPCHKSLNIQMLDRQQGLI
jgi:hypothetical protein